MFKVTLIGKDIVVSRNDTILITRINGEWIYHSPNGGLQGKPEPSFCSCLYDRWGRNFGDSVEFICTYNKIHFPYVLSALKEAKAPLTFTRYSIDGEEQESCL